jgi:hypothetical protein
MSSFLLQTQKYDSATAAATLSDFQSELDDELRARESLDASTADKLAEAKAFLADSSAHVVSQLAQLRTLDTQIREAVATNETLQANDAEYNALVTSEQYVALADDIAQFNALATSLADFLVEKGRRGRPLN